MFNQLVRMNLKEAGQSESLSLLCLYVGTFWSQPSRPWGDLASLPDVLDVMGKAED